MMGRDSGSLIGGKRSRPADDEAYFDNFHNHKRYLTEVMATSLNGLRVGESTSSPPMDIVSPAHTETAGLSRSASSFPTSHGDDLSTLDSPMSDDSDESVGFRMGRAPSDPPAPLPPVSTPDTPTSPVSPRRKDPFPSSRQPTPPPYTPSLPLPCSQPRVKASTTDDGRSPPSPSDPCQSADLRRAALLRSLQIRSQSPIRPVATPEKKALEEGGDTSDTLFSSRAVTRVRSLLLDEPVVVATMALSSTSPQSDAESEQESRFDQRPSQLRSCSKLARSVSCDVIVSDAESRPLRRPPGGMEKTSCKRAKPL